MARNPLPEILKNENPYDILKVTSTDSEKTIKRNYKKIALKLHPDKNKNKNAKDNFNILTKAYEFLLDKELRKQYDLFTEKLKENEERFKQQDKIKQEFQRKLEENEKNIEKNLAFSNSGFGLSAAHVSSVSNEESFNIERKIKFLRQKNEELLKRKKEKLEKEREIFYKKIKHMQENKNKENEEKKYKVNEVTEEKKEDEKSSNDILFRQVAVIHSFSKPLFNCEMEENKYINDFFTTYKGVRHIKKCFTPEQFAKYFSEVSQISYSDRLSPRSSFCSKNPLGAVDCDKTSSKNVLEETNNSKNEFRQKQKMLEVLQNNNIIYIVTFSNRENALKCVIDCKNNKKKKLSNIPFGVKILSKIFDSGATQQLFYDINKITFSDKHNNISMFDHNHSNVNSFTDESNTASHVTKPSTYKTSFVSSFYSMFPPCSSSAPSSAPSSASSSAPSSASSSAFSSSSFNYSVFSSSSLFSNNKMNESPLYKSNATFPENFEADVIKMFKMAAERQRNSQKELNSGK